MSKLLYRGVAVVVPEGDAVEALLGRMDDVGLGRRLLRSLNPAAQAGWRKLVTRIYVAGLQDGVDRALQPDEDTEALADLAAHPDARPTEAFGSRSEPEGRSPVQAVVDRYRRSVLKVPTLSESMSRLNRLLVDPNHDVGEAIDLIDADAGLRAGLLAYTGGNGGGGRPPRSVHEAVARVGHREATRFVLAAGNRGLFAFPARGRDAEMRNVWQHGLATALLADLLAGELEGLHPAACFLHGLMHDCGRAVLTKIFDDLESEATSGPPFGREEVARTLDRLHGQFSQVLLQKWGFGESFAEVAMFHHQPQKAFAHRSLVSVVSLADALAARHGFGAGHDLVADEEEEHAAARLLGLSEDALDFAVRQLRRAYESLVVLT